jgi:hypothetical protein
VTICVGVQVNECLVFAADSAVTLFYGPDHRGSPVINVLPHGNKLFNLHRDLPIAAMTCGLGNIGPASIAYLAKELRLLLMGNKGGDDYALDAASYTIQEVAVKSRKFLFEKEFAELAEKPAAEMSFYVGGYSSDANAPEHWLIKIDENGACPDPICLAGQGATMVSWGGQPEAIYRLVMGVGSNHREALASSGLTREQVDAASLSLTRNMQAPLFHAAMPVQDAIDLANFFVETTKRFVRFLPGADTVGGDTDVAVVTKHEGFKWVQRKHFFNTTLNPSEVSYGARYPAEKGKLGHSRSERDEDA